MSAPHVTCPGCKTLLRSERPIPLGVTLRCPGCKTSFAAPTVPDFALEAPTRSLFGAPFVIALTVSLLLGGAIITAAVLVSGPRPTPVASLEPQAEDAEAKDRSEERRKLESERRDLDRQQRKLEHVRALARGEAALLKNEFSEAEKAFDEALRLDPDSASAIKGLVSAKAALATASKGRDDDRKRQGELDGLLADARKALTAREFARATQILESARQIAPANREVLAALTEAKNGLDADQAEKQKLTDFKKHVDAGKAALVAERFADAVREYAAAVRLMPDDLEAQQGQKQAEGKIAALADKEKRQAAFDGLMERGRKAQADRRYKEAIAALEPALRIVPDDREAQRLLRAAREGQKSARSTNAGLLARADEAVQLGRLEEGVRLAEEAVKNWPEDTAADKVYRNAERLLANARTVQEAYLRNVQNGALAMTTGRYADAVASYAEALRLTPGDLEVARQLRLARVALERDLRVRLDYERLVRGGTLALGRQAFVEAARSFGDALKLVPDDLVAIDGLSKARYGKAMLEGQRALQMRRKAEATAAFEAALAERPTDRLARAGLQQARLLR